MPGNRNLECADPLLRDGAFLTLGDRPMRLAGAHPRRAGDEPGLRPRVGAARDRPPGCLPCRRARGAARGLPATRRPPPRRGRPAAAAHTPRPAGARAARRPPAGDRATPPPRARRRPRCSPIRRCACGAAARTARRQLTTLAVGLDIVTTTTFAEQLADPASAFVDATFTAREQRDARGAGRGPGAAARRALRGQGGVRQGVVGRPRRPRAGARDGRPARDRGRRRRPRPSGAARCTARWPRRSTSSPTSWARRAAARARLAEPRPPDGGGGRRAERACCGQPQVRFGASSRSRHSAKPRAGPTARPSPASGSTMSARPTPSRITSR